jgi:protein-S-isoprenylcysteine O-methyltransferase Ste14
MLALVARFRVALGWVVAPLVLVAADPTLASITSGLVIALGGEAVRFWAAGHLRKAREVTSSGPYRWLAHPLYVGSSVVGAGVAVASANLIAAALIASYLFVTLRAAIRNEEAYLRQTFGDQYDRYRRRGAPARSRRFSFSRAIANREHRAVIGLILAMLLLASKATYNGAFRGGAGGR